MGLFGRDTHPAQREAVETTIGASTTVRGALRSDGGARIDGTFEGNIEVAGNVIIGESGRVIGDIHARNVTVGGAVNGNVFGAGRLEILSTGQVLGDIVVAAVMIDEGGIFQGTSRMTGFEQRALAAPQDAQADAGAKPVIDVGADTVDVTARPAGPSATRHSPRVREHRVAMPNLDLDALDIEPVIPDIVIEDVQDGVTQARATPSDAPAANNRSGSPPGQRPPQGR